MAAFLSILLLLIAILCLYFLTQKEEMQKETQKEAESNKDNVIYSVSIQMGLNEDVPKLLEYAYKLMRLSQEDQMVVFRLIDSMERK